MEEKVGIIYCAINKVNGKLYIGQTIRSLEERMKFHYYEINRKSRLTNKSIFLKALDKYKREDFLTITLWKGDSEKLNDKEIYYIKLFDSKFPNGYNLSEGGGGRRGYTLPQEVKDKISVSNKGRKLSPATIEKQRLSRIGTKRSEETKEKLRIARIGFKHTEESKLKIGAAGKGRKLSEEHKKRIGDASRGRKLSKENIKYLLECRIDKTIYTFYNPIYGIEVLSAYDLSKKYNLLNGNLRKVIAGERNHCGNWRLLTTDNI